MLSEEDVVSFPRHTLPGRLAYSEDAGAGKRLIFAIGDFVVQRMSNQSGKSNINKESKIKQNIRCLRQSQLKSYLKNQ